LNNFEKLWIFWNVDQILYFTVLLHLSLNANLMSVYKIPCYKFPGMFFVEKTWIIYGVQDSNFDVKSRRFLAPILDWVLNCLKDWVLNCRTVTSMLVTYLRDEMCWWQQFNVVSESKTSCNISVGHKHSKDVTNIEFQSPMWTVLKMS